MDYFVSGITVYPVKSCRGIAVESWQVNERGLEYDRQMMIVDTTGRFLSQRQLPKMARISVQIDESNHQLVLAAPGAKEIRLLLDSTCGEEVTVTVQDDTCLAYDQGAAAARWCSDVLGRECRIVQHPSRPVRMHDSSTLGQRFPANFQDAYHLLIIGAASLHDLNACLTLRSKEPVLMNRFRPNLTIAGSDPYEEDEWAHVTIGQIVALGVKPCVRCATVATDQETGTRPDRPPLTIEPLATLLTYRRVGKGNEVIFGSNFVCLTEGMLHVGDRVSVVTRKHG